MGRFFYDDGRAHSVAFVIKSNLNRSSVANADRFEAFVGKTMLPLRKFGRCRSGYYTSGGRPTRVRAASLESHTSISRDNLLD